jgi:hypothetical protein
MVTFLKVISVLDYIAFDDGTVGNNKLEMIWKEAVVA